MKAAIWPNMPFLCFNAFFLADVCQRGDTYEGLEEKPATPTPFSGNNNLLSILQ